MYFAILTFHNPKVLSLMNRNLLYDLGNFQIKTKSYNLI